MRILTLSVFLVSLLFAGSVVAADAVKNYNQVSFDVSVSAEVENDVMVATLYAQEEGSNARDLASRVNSAIKQALEKLEKHKGIRVATQGYSTTPVYSKQQLIGWRVQQSIHLRSRDMVLMGDILGQLQQELKLSGIAFEVSKERSEETRKRLIEEALNAFRQRARQISANLQYDAYRIVSMRVSGLDAPVAPYRQRNLQIMAAKAEVAPVIKAGEATLTARISGTIELE